MVTIPSTDAYEFVVKGVEIEGAAHFIEYNGQVSDMYLPVGIKEYNGQVSLSDRCQIGVR